MGRLGMTNYDYKTAMTTRTLGLAETIMLEAGNTRG